MLRYNFCGADGRLVKQIYGRSVREKYKEYRVHRPFIRKAILWSVLWAAFKTSARAKSKICNIYAVQCTYSTFIFTYILYVMKYNTKV